MYKVKIYSRKNQIKWGCSGYSQKARLVYLFVSFIYIHSTYPFLIPDLSFKSFQINAFELGIQKPSLIPNAND